MSWEAEMALLDAPTALPGEGVDFTVTVYRDRPAWLDGRRQTIGGSDAPALWRAECARGGVKVYGSPLSVYCDKRGLAPEMDDNQALRAGRFLEPAIRAWYADDAGRRVLYPGPFTILRSLRWPWMAVSLDGAALDEVRVGPGALELKNRGARKGGFGEWADGLPLWLQVQMQHAMAVTGWGWASGAGLLGGNRLAWADLERDDRFIAAHVERCRVLSERVEQGDPPDADDSEASADALRALFPADDGQEVQMPLGADLWAAAWAEAGKDEASAEAARRHFENKIRRAVGAAARGVLPDGSVLDLKTQKDGKRVLRWKGK